jgi:hypothetical protein
MRKAPKKVKLRRFNKDDPAFKIIRDAIWKWTARCNLNPDPEMPDTLYGRNADKWHPSSRSPMTLVTATAKRRAPPL